MLPYRQSSHSEQPEWFTDAPYKACTYFHHTKDNLNCLLTLHIRLVGTFITQRITRVVYEHIRTTHDNTLLMLGRSV